MMQSTTENLVYVRSGYLRADIPREVCDEHKHLLWQLKESSSGRSRHVVYATDLVIPDPELWFAVAILMGNGVHTYWKEGVDKPYYPIFSYKHSVRKGNRLWLVLPKRKRMF